MALWSIVHMQSYTVCEGLWTTAASDKDHQHEEGMGGLTHEIDELRGTGAVHQ